MTDLEAQLGIALPTRHWRAMLDPADPIHGVTDLLLPDTPHDLLRIIEVNRWLHADGGHRWPAFLVAFATTGCGDYFAYDSRTDPMRVVYIDPIGTPEDNLANANGTLEFESFERWYDYETAKRVR